MFHGSWLGKWSVSWAQRTPPAAGVFYEAGRWALWPVVVLEPQTHHADHLLCSPCFHFPPHQEQPCFLEGRGLDVCNLTLTSESEAWSALFEKRSCMEKNQSRSQSDFMLMQNWFFQFYHVSFMVSWVSLFNTSNLSPDLIYWAFLHMNS